MRYDLTDRRHRAPAPTDVNPPRPRIADPGALAQAFTAVTPPQREGSAPARSEGVQRPVTVASGVRSAITDGSPAPAPVATGAAPTSPFPVYAPKRPDELDARRYTAERDRTRNRAGLAAVAALVPGLVGAIAGPSSTFGNVALGLAAGTAEGARRLDADADDAYRRRMEASWDWLQHTGTTQHADRVRWAERADDEHIRREERDEERRRLQDADSLATAGELAASGDLDGAAALYVRGRRVTPEQARRLAEAQWQAAEDERAYRRHLANLAPDAPYRTAPVPSAPGAPGPAPAPPAAVPPGADVDLRRVPAPNGPHVGAEGVAAYLRDALHPDDLAALYGAA